MRAIQPVGHAHELTFSCYRRLPPLASGAAKGLVIESLNEARKRQDFDVWAFVVMPEHAHLLIHPRNEKYQIARILMTPPIAKKILEELRHVSPDLMDRLRVAKRDGTLSYRFWQAGGGYDRNLYSPRAIRASIANIHANPVRRGLCESELDWEWSSARAYAGHCSDFAIDRCEAAL